MMQTTNGLGRGQFVGLMAGYMLVCTLLVKLSMAWTFVIQSIVRRDLQLLCGLRLTHDLSFQCEMQGPFQNRMSMGAR